MRWRYIAVIFLLGACSQSKPLVLYFYGVSTSGTHFHVSFSEQQQPSGAETTCSLVTDSPKTQLNCQNAEMTHPYQDVTEVSFSVAGTLEGHPFGQVQSVKFHYEEAGPGGPYQLAGGDLAVLPRVLCVVSSETDVPTQEPGKTACAAPVPAAK